jgi:chemotaxis protein methyltransferase CheR
MNLTSAPIQLEMTDEEYRLLRNLVYDECGIWLKDEKKTFLMNRALRRMNALNITSYYRYFKLLTDRKERNMSFSPFWTRYHKRNILFRNKPQMDVFADIVLPEIVSRKRGQKDTTLKI